jgi:hypothetical protein
VLTCPPSVPYFVRLACRHIFLRGIHEEGIFRIPGVTERLDSYCARLDEGTQRSFFSWLTV